ncbi:TPA: toxin [Salmonella enterica]
MNNMKLVIIIFLINILAGCVTSASNELNGVFDSENGSLFSIRNIQSGFMIPNTLDQHGRELKGWQLVPKVTPVEVLVNFPGGWVQFKDPFSSNCLAAQRSLAINKSTCDINNKDTLFILIPSTTGAVQIQSVSSGLCIIDKGSNDNFQFGKCIADFQHPDLIIPEKNLWMLNPPVTASSVAPLRV